ncbi:MAG: hypothetical protein AAFY47_04735 [Pseudomonadota bacterium]
MKGQILGFDGAKGAITGEDGNRYSFELAEWKGEKAPQPRDSVDFVAADGVATEIYKTAGSFAAPSLEGVGDTLSGVSASISGVAEKVDLNSGKLEYLRTRPKLILIGLAIFAFFFLNLVVFVRDGYSAFTLPGNLDDAAALVGLFGRGGDFSITSSAAMLLWAIPLAGGFAVFREVTGKKSRMAELITAGACLFSFIVYAMVIAAFENLNTGYQNFADAIKLGFGGYIFILCGVGLILTSFGIVKTVPGWPKPKAGPATKGEVK